MNATDHRYEANRQTLGSMLSSTSPQIVVPEWQRSYSWESSQVEAFWNDLLSFDRQYPEENVANEEYFLGSVVLVTGGERLLLLDGQQRLATATVLLSVLRDARKEYKADSATRLQAKYIADHDDATNSTRYVLNMNVYDRDFFRAEIQSDPSVDVKPIIKSHARVRKARDYFKRKLNEEMDHLGSPKDQFERNLRVERVLTKHMSVVVISSSDEDNAATVFETLNDRGIGLSTPDLLRNLLIRRATDDVAREGVIGAWQSILSVEDDFSVDQLLRHYWVSVQGDVKQRALYREIKDAIVAEDVNSLSFSRNLASASATYRELVQCQAGDERLRRSLEAIKALGASVTYPMLLSAVAVARPDEADQVATLAEILVALFVRYNVIGGRETTILEAAIYKSASTLRENGDFSSAIDTLRALAPPLSEFEASFARVSISRGPTARYILRELEHHVRTTEELSVQGPSKVHVEHIYPQTPQEGKKLANHSGVVNLLGNLTLLSKLLNISIRNAVFESKKSSYGTSEIAITKRLAGNDRPWDADAIKDRQRWMAGLAKEIWSFPGESGEEAVDHFEPAEAGDSGDQLNSAELPDLPDPAANAD